VGGYGVDIEVWAFGRLPLALSARCYHARLAGLAKDSCQFVCEQDPDGLPVETLDGHPILAINGVQTVSERWANLAGDLTPLAEAGVGAGTALRQRLPVRVIRRGVDPLNRMNDRDAAEADLTPAQLPTKPRSSRTVHAFP